MSTLELLRPDPPIAQPIPSLMDALAPTLTRRERIVLAHLLDDLTLEAIASQLWVSRNTVKSQVRSVYRKIGVSTRAEAVAWATSAGLSSPHPGRESVDVTPRARAAYSPTNLVASEQRLTQTTSSTAVYR